jgi:ABC-type branched-subunit amino acid transport system substrate-binding protein
MRSSALRPVLALAAGAVLAAAATAGAGDAPAAPREPAIGLLLPADDGLARETSRGASAAADLLRAAGTPVRIVERRAKGPWGSEAGEVVKLVYEDGVAAVVTGPDRGSSHLAAQVAAKARVPVVIGSGASALTRIPLPWMVRVVPDERAVLASLLGAVPGKAAGRTFVGFVDGGREGARLAEEIRRAARKAGWGDPVAAPLGPAGEGAAEAARAAAASGASAALVAASPGPAAAALRALRAAGWTGTVLLLPVPDAASLLLAAGDAAEGAVLPRTFDPAAGGAAAELARVYRARWREEPGEVAAAAFDAVGLVARAVRSTDGSAEAVRGAMLAAPPLVGATGRIALDADGDRVGPVPLAVVRGGALASRRETTEESR